MSLWEGKRIRKKNSKTESKRKENNTEKNNAQDEEIQFMSF